MDELSLFRLVVIALIATNIWSARDSRKTANLLSRTFEHFDRRVSVLETICGVDEDNHEETK